MKEFNRRYPTSYRNRRIILSELTTGVRVSDLVRLRWDDIEQDSGRCHIRQGKGRKDRVIFIKPNVLSDLVDIGEERSGLVFTTLHGKPVRDQYLWRMIGEKAKKAGITRRVHFHLLRHAYPTRLYSQTKDLRLVQEVAGHADISTTQIYTHIHFGTKSVDDADFRLCFRT